MKNLILFSFLLIINACSHASDDFLARVISISDGDTVTVLTGQKTQIKIRLSGIDCPESSQPWGQNAKQAIADYIFGETIVVRPVTKDRYGRLVATLFKDGNSVNRYLVGNGQCHVYPRYARDPELFKLHDQAKSNQIGLWSMPENQIIEPWNFRKQK